MDLTQGDLEKLLREAEAAHGAYEQKLGHRDENWPSWYAEFIVKRLREREKEK
jgi:16S rRNA C967 or C1407 C5-methylase (RsmB/RsmF family)